MLHRRKLLQGLKTIAAGSALVWLAACSTIDQGQAPALQRNEIGRAHV